MTSQVEPKASAEKPKKKLHLTIRAADGETAKVHVSPDDALQSVLEKFQEKTHFTVAPNQIPYCRAQTGPRVRSPAAGQAKRSARKTVSQRPSRNSTQGASDVETARFLPNCPFPTSLGSEVGNESRACAR